jgi:hypothetical protein
MHYILKIGVRQSFAPPALCILNHLNPALSAGLTVESQEVVPIKTRAADRRSVVKATMRPVPVVVVKPGKKVVMALLRVLIQAGVSPFA